MKRVMLTMCISVSALSASAECGIISVRPSDVTQKFNKYGGWSIPTQKYNELCSKLSRANARVEVSASATVLVNQSIGWASLTVRDLDTGIGSSAFSSRYTQVESYASQDRADELMVLAINNAAANWAWLDKALGALEDERKKVKLAYSGQK